VKYLVTTNVDGLHHRSGIPVEKVSAIHGDIYKERCSKCNKVYFRHFDILGHVRQRFTGRLCESEGCDGQLVDTIVNFGEYLSDSDYKPAIDNASIGDMYVVLGSSLSLGSVDIALKCQRRKNPFVIINLQKTKFDHLCTIRFFCKIDYFFEQLMKKLNIEVKEYDPSLDPVTGNIPVTNKLFIGNINGPEETISYFGKYGTIIETIDTKDNGIFIAYENPESVDQALQENGKEIVEGKKLNVVKAFGKLYQSFYDISKYGTSKMDEPPPNDLLKEIQNFSSKKLKKVNKEN